MAYDLDAMKGLGQSAMNAVSGVTKIVWNNLTDNRVIKAVQPHFEKYAQPYLTQAYNALPEQVKAHSYVAGGAAVVVAYIAVKTLFSGAKKA